MTTEERIQLCCLAERILKHKEYASRIGLEVAGRPEKRTYQRQRGEGEERKVKP